MRSYNIKRLLLNRFRKASIFEYEYKFHQWNKYADDCYIITVCPNVMYAITPHKSVHAKLGYNCYSIINGKLKQTQNNVGYDITLKQAMERCHRDFEYFLEK